VPPRANRLRRQRSSRQAANSAARASAHGGGVHRRCRRNRHRRRIAAYRSCFLPATEVGLDSSLEASGARGTPSLRNDRRPRRSTLWGGDSAATISVTWRTAPTGRKRASSCCAIRGSGRRCRDARILSEAGADSRSDRPLGLVRCSILGVGWTVTEWGRIPRFMRALVLFDSPQQGGATAMPFMVMTSDDGGETGASAPAWAPTPRRGSGLGGSMPWGSVQVV
jgi:hypothetical protein